MLIFQTFMASHFSTTRFWTTFSYSMILTILLYAIVSSSTLVSIAPFMTLVLLADISLTGIAAFSARSLVMYST